MNIDNVLEQLDIAPQALYDIGVGQRPHDEAKQFKEKYPDIEVFGTEPQIDVYIDRQEDYCGKVYPWGIWSHATVLQLNKTACKGNSSILRPTEYYSNHIDIIGYEFISCVTLDQFDHACGKKNEIFLWMDIEGAELTALFGATLLLRSGRLRWVYLEVSNEKQRRRFEPKAHQIDKKLSKFGFELHWKFNECAGHHNRLYRRK